MLIEILDHNFSRIQLPLPKELRELLSYKSGSFNHHTKRMKFTTNCVVEDTGVFLTGLVDFIKENYHQPIEVVDQRRFPDVTLQLPKLTDPVTGNSFEFREYQIDYLVQALKLRRMIFDSETGSGKTAMMASIIDCLGLPTQIIAPNKTILAQLHKELSLLLPHIRFGTDRDGNVEESPYLIGLSGTLVKLPSQVSRQYKVTLVDESYTAAAKQTMDVILQTNSPYRFGFAGNSKGRSDNRDLIVFGLLGNPVKLIDRKQLQEQGFSPEIQLEIHRGWFGGEYHVLEDLLIVHNPKRNELITSLVKAHAGRNKTILVLVQRREHGKILESMIPNSLFVFGDTEMDEREAVRQRMKQGTLKVLIASKVFAIGLDIPNLEIGINAAGGKAEILTGQRLGRVMRVWENTIKKWIDIDDSGYHSILGRHSLERMRIYKEKQLKINFVDFPPGMQKKLEDELIKNDDSN